MNFRSSCETQSMQRRSLLKLGVTAAVALSVVGGAVAWLQPGLERGALSPLGREVFRSVGAAVLDKTLPVQDGAREIALEGLLQRVDVLVSALPQHTQNELSPTLRLKKSKKHCRPCAYPVWHCVSRPMLRCMRSRQGPIFQLLQAGLCWVIPAL